MKIVNVGMLVASIAVLGGCSDGNERLIEKAKIEGRETAKAELDAQLKDKDKLIEKAAAEGRAAAEAELKFEIENIETIKNRAREEGKVQAEAELSVQKEHLDELINRARLEGKATAEEELIAENENLKKRSTEMEADLSTRHKFYQAVAGTYEGDLVTGEGKFKVRLKLTPSISPYPISRIRLPEEIANDIQNLHFNLLVVEWNAENKDAAAGCRIEGLKPSIVEGEATVTKESCSSLYAFRLFDKKVVQPDEVGKPNMAFEFSERVVKEILAGKITQVSEIHGEKQLTTNANIYTFKAKRVSK